MSGTAVRVLLAAAGGTGGFILRRAFEVIASPIGAWPSWTHAFYNADTGSSMFGAVSSSGSVRSCEYVHATGTASTKEIGVLSGDQHNSPAIIRRSSDSRYLSLYSDHSGPQMYGMLATNANDNSAWGLTYHLDDELGGTAYTYAFLAQLGDEASDPIYAIYRDVPSVNSAWCLSKSTGGGADGTWAAQTVLVNAGLHYYFRAVKSSESRLDFALTDGTRADEFASLYHFYYDGAYRKSDGTSMGSPPFDPSDMTLVYDGSSEGVRIPNSIQKVGSEIAIAFPVYTGGPAGAGDIGTDGDYKVARWNGSSWSLETLATAVGMVTVHFSDGGVSLDPSNLDRAAAGIRVGGVYQMHLCTRNAGVWSCSTLTSGTDDNIYPWWVIDHQPGLEFIWQRGTFVTEDDFTAAVWGYGT